jgi:hypothetical protein
MSLAKGAAVPLNSGFGIKDNTAVFNHVAPSIASWDMLIAGNSRSTEVAASQQQRHKQPEPF